MVLSFLFELIVTTICVNKIFIFFEKVHHGGELQVRGKKDSIEFLKWACKNGCEVVVITGTFFSQKTFLTKFLFSSTLKYCSL